MSDEYSVLKEKCESLIKSLEEIDKESLSFALSRKELHELAGNLSTVCGTLSRAVDTADKTLEQVESVAVEKTLKRMDGMVQQYSEISEKNAAQLLDQIKANQANVMKRVSIMTGVSVVSAIIAVVCLFIR